MKKKIPKRNEFQEVLGTEGVGSVAKEPLPMHSWIEGVSGISPQILRGFAASGGDSWKLQGRQKVMEGRGLGHPWNAHPTLPERENRPRSKPAIGTDSQKNQPRGTAASVRHQTHPWSSTQGASPGFPTGKRTEGAHRGRVGKISGKERIFGKEAWARDGFVCTRVGCPQARKEFLSATSGIGIPPPPSTPGWMDPLGARGLKWEKWLRDQREVKEKQ